jgi:hypothetical protein
MVYDVALEKAKGGKYGLPTSYFGFFASLRMKKITVADRC